MRLLAGRRVDDDRLEPPLQRAVLLDVLAVLVHRRGADALDLAAAERRLEHVGRVDGALGPAGADQRVQLVDEQDHVLGPADLVHDRLDALLELAAVLRAGDHHRQVQRDDPPVVRGSPGTSLATIFWARPSTMAVLPTPASPSSTGLFFVRRQSTWMTRSISSCRPITGSSWPSRASSVRSRPKLSRAGVLLLPRRWRSLAGHPAAGGGRLLGRLDAGAEQVQHLLADLVELEARGSSAPARPRLRARAAGRAAGARCRRSCG